MAKPASIRRLLTVAAVSCAVTAPVAQAAATCNTLAVSDNNFISSLLTTVGLNSSLAARLPLANIFAEFDAALPWLSTCAAAIKPGAIVSDYEASSTLQSCISNVESIDWGANDLGALFIGTICPMYKNKIVPCVTSALQDNLLEKMSNTDGCCGDFQAKIKTLFSDDLDVMVEKLLQFVGNTACSQRTYANLKGTTVTEMCGYSIINSFMNFEEADWTDLLQIPNAVMCDAFEGKSFTNTKGGTSQFAFNVDDIDSMGVCVQPVDALLTHLRTWPIFQQTLDGGSEGTFSLKDWFAADKSITGDKFIAWAVGTDNLPMIVVRTIDKVFDALMGDASASASGSSVESLWGDYASGEEFFNALAGEYTSELAAFATHIPNSADCTYSSQEISEPYSVASTGSVNGVASVRVSGSSALVVQVAVVMALLAPMMTFA